jgi:hypothetical protein
VLIEDWPDVKIRGFMLDISRDRVPTRETLERFLDLMAKARYNQFQLYTEHTFAYPEHEAVWKHASPITADDIKWLQAKCQERGIELVPNQNTFGHFERWLALPEYADRAESPQGFDWGGRHRSPSVLQPTQDNADFALSLVDELTPLFDSDWVNIGADETFELGQGKSAELVKEKGVHKVYFEHLMRLVKPLTDKGKKVQFWADVLEGEPELGADLPENAIPIAWRYEDPAKGRSLEYDAQLLEKSGRPFWLAPGLGNWNSFTGRLDVAIANLTECMRVAKEHECEGVLVTSWGDNGHMEPPSISFVPLVLGGAYAWDLSANRALDPVEVANEQVFDDPSGVAGQVFVELGFSWKPVGPSNSNGSALFMCLIPSWPPQWWGEAQDPEVVEEVGQELLSLIDRLKDADMRCKDAELVKEELVHAAKMAKLGADVLLESETVTEERIAQAKLKQAELWLKRSRPGGLQDSLGKLLNRLSDFTEIQRITWGGQERR